MTSLEEQFARFRGSGDARALGAVFDALAPELLLVAAHVAPAATDAEDLVQATFLDAIEKAARWDAARPLLPWLIGILVNHARAVRRQHARELDPARLLPTVEPSPLEQLAQQETAERIAAAVRALPRQYRQVLTLRLVHGLSPTAIAHALGCPVATCKTRLSRGMDWLRRALPASLAGAVALVAAGRGLAQVRAVVLERAATLVPVAGAVGSLSLLLGGLAVKKLALALAAAVLALVAWIALQPSEIAPAAAPRANAPSAASVAAVPDAAARDHGAAPSTGAADARTAVATDPAATTGALALQFVWADDGSPAAHLHVSCQTGSDSYKEWRTNAEGVLQKRSLEPG